MNQIKLKNFIASHQAPDPEHWQLHRVLRIFGTAKIVQIHLPAITEEKVATITANWLKYVKQRKERNEMQLKEAL
ncbi:hypothetical protein X975_16971, partial [Stegodyphus mimosarum]